MAFDNQRLGGRLPLINPDELTPSQQRLYQQINGTLISWSEQVGFIGKTADGHFVGPFNPFLFSPDISEGFLKLQEAESRFTTLEKRTREVVILSVGAVWKAEYELYAHSAAAAKAGLSQQAIRALVSGGISEDLTADEVTAHRFTRQICTEYRVDAALYREAEHAFGKEALTNMMFLIGIYMFTCALLNGFEIPIPPGDDHSRELTGRATSDLEATVQTHKVRRKI